MSIKKYLRDIHMTLLLGYITILLSAEQRLKCLSLNVIL